MFPKTHSSSREIDFFVCLTVLFKFKGPDFFKLNAQRAKNANQGNYIARKTMP